MIVRNVIVASNNTSFLFDRGLTGEEILVGIFEEQGVENDACRDSKEWNEEWNRKWKAVEMEQNIQDRNGFPFYIVLYSGTCPFLWPMFKYVHESVMTLKPLQVVA